MFPIRRAALRLLSSSPTSFVVKSRTFITAPQASLRAPRQSTFAAVQRRWATDGAAKEDVPVSKLQPTAQEEVENALSEDSTAGDVASSSTATEAHSSSRAPTVEDTSFAETANATEATEEQYASPDSYRDDNSFKRTSPLETSPKPTVYVGNLFFDVTEDDLTKELSRFGNIKNVRLIRDARGLSKGFGYVSFDSIDAASEAIAGMNQQLFEGRRLSIQFATRDMAPQKPRSPPRGPSNPPSKTLFIGNMSWEMTDRDLTNLFKGIRNVIDVRVAIDRRTGQPRGFAHADFMDVKSAMEAMKILEGKETYGRTLRLDYSYGSSSAPRNQARESEEAPQ